MTTDDDAGIAGIVEKERTEWLVQTASRNWRM